MGPSRVTLTRTKESKDGQGTFGIIRRYFGEVLDFEFKTGELLDRQNRNSISRVLPGVYRCAWAVSQHFPQGTFELEDKNGRTGVRIHIGNWCGDTALGWCSDVEGCIILGTVQEVRPCPKNGGKRQEGVFNSTVAFGEFNKKMARDPFDLEIVEEFV
jgi:hypothetical protein